MTFTSPPVHISPAPAKDAGEVAVKTAGVVPLPPGVPGGWKDALGYADCGPNSIVEV